MGLFDERCVKLFAEDSYKRMNCSVEEVLVFKGEY
jgi:hypothetical protein